VVALIFCAVCCHGGSADQATHEVTLRVAASHGLSEFAPNENPSGSTAAAIDLVWAPIHTHVLPPTVEGSTVTLRRRPGSPYTCKELADALAFPGIRNVTVGDGDEMVVEFENVARARAFADVGTFALGPYELASQTDGMVRLRSREPRPIGAIDIVEVPLGDQWRRLLGHQIDVIPVAAAAYRGAFAGMRSIRVVDLPAQNTFGLAFNMERPELSEVCARRAIARALDHEAIATVACGSAECAVDAPAEGAMAADSCQAPRDLVLILMVGDSTGLVAGRTIRHQLRKVGISTSIEQVPLGELAERLRAGSFDLAFLPLSSERERSLYRFSRAGMAEGLNVSHYNNPAFDEALADGDLDRAEAVLRRDIPVIPLYEMRTFAAIDARFCGGKPTSTRSWLWLADLRPCAEGEGP